MCTSVPSILGAFLGLNILSAQANVSCTKSQEVISARAPALAKALQDSLNQSSKGPCDAEFWDTDFSTYRTESTVFTITHAKQDGNLESCKDSFDAIIRQCIGENGHGGTLLADGFLYEVYHDDTLEGGLAKRASPKPAKPVVKPASPAVKSAKPVKPVKPVNPVKPATPATLKPVKPVPAPATPAKPANNNKGCSPKPKGKNSRL